MMLTFPRSAPETTRPMMLPKTLLVQIAPLPEQVVQVRRALAAWLERQNWPQDDRDGVLLAVGEACSNAVCYGEHEYAGAVVSVCCRMAASGSLRVQVRNSGTRFAPDMAQQCRLPEWDATHGRGFALMQALMDSVRVTSNGRETVVHLTKRRAV